MDSENSVVTARVKKEVGLGEVEEGIIGINGDG